MECVVGLDHGSHALWPFRKELVGMPGHLCHSIEHLVDEHVGD